MEPGRSDDLVVVDQLHADSGVAQNRKGDAADSGQQAVGDGLWAGNARLAAAAREGAVGIVGAGGLCSKQ